MWQGLKRIFFGDKTRFESSRNAFRLSDEGIYPEAIHRPGEAPLCWSWESVCEFGLSVHQAIYPDPWFGDYMEAEWFFTLENGEGPQRLFFDIDYFSMEALPAILPEKLPGFDSLALEEGWREYRAGPRNYEGAGQWIAWRKQGFIWPPASEQSNE